MPFYKKINRLSDSFTGIGDVPYRYYKKIYITDNLCIYEIISSLPCHSPKNLDDYK
jgi:hypothetical protein